MKQQSSGLLKRRLFIALVCIYALSISACGIFGTSAAKIRAQLRSEWPDERREAILQIARKHRVEFALIVAERLKDSDALVRSAAAEALGKLGARNTIEALVVALDDPEPMVRWDVVKALGALRATEAVDDLIRVGRFDTNVNVRREAAKSLGRIGGPKAIEGLVRIVRDRDRSVRYAAARALSKCTGRPFTLDPDAWEAWFEAQSNKANKKGTKKKK